MKLRTLLIACCGFCSADVIFAQTERTADPISGAWTGYAIPSSSNAQPIGMELKFDGKDAVSGTVSGLPRLARHRGPGSHLATTWSWRFAPVLWR